MYTVLWSYPHVHPQIFLCLTRTIIITFPLLTQADKAGKRAVEVLQDTAFYLCCHIKTISNRKNSLPLVLADLDFFFIAVDDARAQAIVAAENGSKFKDVLDNGRFNIRVGLGEAGSPQPQGEYYLYTYYTHISSHPRRELVGGVMAHEAAADGRITGTSPAKLCELRSQLFTLKGMNQSQLCPCCTERESLTK